MTYHYEKTQQKSDVVLLKSEKKTSDKQTSPDRAAVAYRMTSRTSGTTGKTQNNYAVTGK